MAKAMYTVGILIVIAALIGIFIFYGKAYGTQVGSSQVTIPRNNTATTLLTTSTKNVSYNTTTVAKAPSCSAAPGYSCTYENCASTNSSLSCSNSTYTNSTSKAYLWVTISQDTGQEWSGYGVAFAPTGTKIVSGTPQGITYYTADYASSSNVGTSLQSGDNATVRITIQKTNGAYPNALSGTIWACYSNSGILYVGNGCTTSSGLPARYVETGSITG